MLCFGKKNIVGLDIGSSSVKAVSLEKRDGGYAVMGASMADFAGASNAGKAIRKCIRGLSSSSKYVVCGVCGSDVVVRGFSFPDMPAEQIDQAVRLEAQQMSPLDIHDCSVEYQVVEAGDNEKITGVMAISTKKDIRKKMAMANDASLRCVLMDVNDIATLNCYCEIENPDLSVPVAILDVGHTHSTISILGQDNIPFLRSLPIAGNGIAKKIAQANGVTVEIVTAALTGKGKVSFDLQNNLIEASKELIAGVNETIRYHSNTKGTRPLSSISVCGGFAMVDGFVDILNAGLTVSAKMWNPFEKMNFDSGFKNQEILNGTGAAFAVSAGLAMRSI